jgi:AcrR family transcriptional regulator
MSASAKNPGLRERKKAKTRETIQHHALELFRKQGYAATTVDQIVTAAEVSESTFFRYFPTKEAVVLTDELDPLFAAAFREQPAKLGLVAALRRAMRSVFETMSADELADLRDRSVMILDVPELWGAALVQLTEGMQLIADMVAERLGRTVDDLEVRAFAGAFTGVMIGLQKTWAEQPEVDIVDSLDEAMAYLQAGLPIGRKAR